MAGENYTVQYNIKVNDNGAAKVLQSFTTATANLTKAEGNLDLFAKKINEITGQLNNMARKSPTLKINTGTVNRQLDNIIRKLERIQALSKQRLTLSATTVAGGRGGRGTTTGVGVGGGKPQSGPAPMGGGTSSPKPKVVPATPKRTTSGGGRGGTRYQALGQTLIDTGGVGVLDFAKGIGIAYGIAGLGSLMGNVVRDATDYNNIIQTTKNILGTHDKAPNFEGRFKDMERIVRQVGIETKFTAPQVADASKFLAMAGFDLEAINKSIRPIADIALVGDNDLGQTADVVTNIMTGYGISPDRVRQAADVMTMTFTKSNTTLMEIAESYKYAASLLALNGTSFEEATAAIGILGDAGIKGSQAGTTMRTMALNIAKPTKAQREMWERLGISRTDANGNIRPLIDIFTDLNEKNLNLTQFGSLFHKTATQGAASLAAHVDKWNEMIRLNFLSDGVTSKLAEEKKNTIQGLWYQLTSSFTEAGMQAFEDQESPIREMLNKGIAWLKTPETIEKIKRLSAAIIDIGKTLINFTRILMHLYERFEGFITFWLKAQLYMKGVLIPLRVISSVRNFAAYMLNAARAIGLATTNMGAFNAQFWKISAEAASRGYSQATATRWMGAHSTNVGTPFATAMRGVSMIGGGLVGGYLGSHIGAEGSTVSAFGAVGGALAGTAVGGYLPGWIGKLLAIIPGWGKIVAIIAAALAGLGYAIHSHREKVQTAIDANEKWLASTKNIQGINFTDAATATDKYLQLVYDKQLNANSALAKYIELREKELGLATNATQEAEDNTPFKELEKYQESYNNARLAISKDGLDIHTTYGINQLTHQAWYDAWMDFNGYRLGVGGYGNKRSAINAVADQYAAAQYLYGLGSSFTEGSAAQMRRDNLIQSLLQSSSLEEWNKVMESWQSEKASMLSSVIPGSGNWSMKQVGGNSLSDNQKSYHYVAGFVNAIDTALQEHPTISAWLKILTALSQDNTQLPQSLQEEYFKSIGAVIFDKEKFGEHGAFGSKEFLNYLGFADGQWQGYTHLTGNKISYLDPKTGKMVTEDEKSVRTSEQARQDYLNFHQQISDAVRKVSPKIQPYFNSFIDADIWHPEEQMGLVDGKSTQELNGIIYTWKNGMWVAPKPTGLPDLTNTQMNQKLKAASALLGGQTSSSNGTTSASTNPGYTNQYKSTSATPKQIIVKIENLMNVESVDMSDPNVAATINNLKEQMAQALIDVVEDFDANASNLT